MNVFHLAILLIMILGAVATAISKNILASVIIFMVYSLMMAVLWQQMNAPDLAITEAAVGAGITSVMFFIALRRMGANK